MDAVQLMRDLREMQEWLAVTEKAVTKVKIIEKGGVEKTFHHININKLVRNAQNEQRMVGLREPMRIQNGFVEYLGLYLLFVAFVGLISVGLSSLYDKYCKSKLIEDNKDKNKNALYDLKPNVKKAYKFKHLKTSIQSMNFKKEILANFGKTFNIKNKNNVKDNESSKAEHIQAAVQVNIKIKLGQEKKYEI